MHFAPLGRMFLLIFLGLAIGALAQQPPAGGAPKHYSFAISAAKPWNDTGIDLVRGQVIHVYGGVISCGGPTPLEKNHLPLASAPGGVLLVKLHLDAPPVSATPDAEIPVVEPSHLFMGVNGSGCAGGNIPARVDVYPAPPANQGK